MRKTSAWVFMGLVVVFFLSSVVLAAPKPVHSILKVNTSTSGEKIKISFSTETVKDIVINRDPNTDWRLKILKAEGIDVPAEIGSSEYDDKLQGFYLISAKKPTLKNWSLDFKMIVFVCTKDKTQCYREVHEGNVKAGS